MTQHSPAIGGRGAWVPSWPLIGAKVLELRKRRTLVTVTVAFTIALPVIFYGIRLIYHLADPARYAPAGAPNAFATAGSLMDEFGFIVAVTLGATAGTTDLTDGMFRHLVITGRSRLALYLARIPAGLSILLSLAAAGFTVACLVTAFLGSPHAAGGPVVRGRHGPFRPVARARPAHRVHGRARPRLAHGSADRAGHPAHRAGDHHHPGTGRSPAALLPQRRAPRRRRRHGPAETGRAGRRHPRRTSPRRCCTCRPCPPGR